MFSTEKHPNGYASIIGHGLQSQDARAVSYAEGQRIADTFNCVESGLRADLQTQIEAKCKAITRAEQLQKMNDTQADTIRERGMELERRNAGYQLLVRQKANLKKRVRDLVSLVNGIQVGQQAQANKPTSWPHWATHLFRDEDGWQFGKLVKEGYFIDSDSEATASQCWNRQNMIDGTLEERPAHEGVTLKTATNGAGQQYVSGIGVDPSQFLVDADKVYINKAVIAESTLDEARVVNVTTNHFTPEPKASKKQLAALREALGFVKDLHTDGKVLAPRLRKLLKKLS